MLFRQNKDTFIRHFNTFGYIVSQLTKHDRIYDGIGNEFLKQISRRAKCLSDAISELRQKFPGVAEDVIGNDFVEFLQELEHDRYISISSNQEELISAEPRFSYNDPNPKTSTFSFLNQDQRIASEDTENFLFRECQSSPILFDLSIEITSRCNERCVHCYIPHEWKTENLDFAVARQVITDATEMGAVSVTLTGGEATTDPNFEKYLLLLREKDFMITVLSNGMDLGKRLIDSLQRANINLIQVSLYSMDETVHDRITQVPGSFRRTMNSLEALLENDIPVQISCPVNRINATSYKDVAKFAIERKVKVNTDFVLMARADFDQSNLAHRLGDDEIEGIVRDVMESDPDYKTRLQFEPRSKNLSEHMEKPVCGVGISTICLSSRGDFFPCAGWQGYVLGNAYKERLPDIWKSSEKLNFLRGIKNSSFPKCIACEAVDYCSMCMVRNFNESNGDLFAINEHFCKVAHITKQLAEALE